MNRFFLKLFVLLLKILAFSWAVFGIMLIIYILLQDTPSKGALISTISFWAFTIFIVLIAVVEMIEAVTKIEENTERILKRFEGKEEVEGQVKTSSMETH